ncbi:hypothetical protein [Changpingibacter yushuensis]|uniref:hypothetical protein n=1 Tax=Changpingibacter yushuensis TaxID=2758440 RepID=UPI00165D5CE5|nr:hypothetical protein [Changpingibacter yushuensis]
MTDIVNKETGEVIDQDLAEHDFSVFVATAEDGVLDADCSDALRDLTAKVMRIGKAGKMTLTVVVEKVDNGIQAVKIRADMKVTPPRLPRSSSIRFVNDKTQSLSENPPNQRIILNRDLTIADDTK